MVASQLTTVGRPLQPSGSRSARRRRAAKCAQQRHTGALLCLGAVRTRLLLAVGCALCCLDVTVGQEAAVEIDASICVPDASIEELQVSFDATFPANLPPTGGPSPVSLSLAGLSSYDSTPRSECLEIAPLRIPAGFVACCFSTMDAASVSMQDLSSR